MLKWLRSGPKAKTATSPLVPELITLVCRHVQDQVSAFTGRHVEPMPSYSRMTDLLIGAYIWGLLEGCLRNLPGTERLIQDEQARDEQARVTVMAATLAPNSSAAAGNAGTNMCIAKVPLKVMSASSQSGGCFAEIADPG